VTVTGNAPGTATVTVSVEDGRGGTASASFGVTVVQPNQNPVIQPIAPVTLAVGETQDIAYSASDPDGDPIPNAVAVSDNEAVVTASSPAVGTVTLTASSPGTATVTVGVQDSRGGRAQAAFTVTVQPPIIQPTEPPPPPPPPPSGTVDLNGIPDVVPVKGDIQNTARQIYRHGQSVTPAANPGIFSAAGDTPPGQFLADLGDGAAFDGLNDSSDLGALLFYYAGTTLPVGGNSFQGGGLLASNQNWRASDLLDPSQSDPNWCQSGETPINCELRVNRPSVLFVVVGRNDVLQNTPQDQFQTALDQIVQVSIKQGAIPVLATIPGDPNRYPALPVLNTAIVNVAEHYHLPVINLWRRIDRVGPTAIDPNNLTLTTSGVGDQFTGAELNTYGVPNRNLLVLRMLQEIRTKVPIP
jgi:hypothetical protein